MQNKFMSTIKTNSLLALLLASAITVAGLNTGLISEARAQDVLPMDNGMATYHTAPRYRESESHPLRLVGYVLHPVGWVIREGIFRPLSYFASSTETRRSVMGFREPFDYRQPECFSADESSPDCRAIPPFNYETVSLSDGSPSGVVRRNAGDSYSSNDGATNLERSVYFPDVNFDFNSRNLNDLGRGRAHQIAKLLVDRPGLHVVLQGHADYKGGDKYNEKLGLDRSETVRQELISLGVPADRLSSVTFGETQPLLSEEENWARAVNRRVQVQVGDGEIVSETSVSSEEQSNRKSNEAEPKGQFSYYRLRQPQ